MLSGSGRFGRCGATVAASQKVFWLTLPMNQAYFRVKTRKVTERIIQLAKPAHPVGIK